jgi:uncharacterized protein (TIGR02391 family)
MEFRRGHEFVPVEDILALPVPEVALRLLLGMVEMSNDHYGRSTWSFVWILSNTQVRAEERGASRVSEAVRKLGDALAWLVSNALLAPVASDGEWRVSALGAIAAQERSLAGVLAERRLAVDLHPRLSDARAIFSLGTHDAAVLEAMKQVEERVRELSGLSGFGVDLVNRAFNPGKATVPPGPLTDPSPLDPQETRGTRDLFAGAVAAFRNPAAHRAIDYADPSEAAEVVLLADLLLRMLERVEQRLAAP